MSLSSSFLFSLLQIRGSLVQNPPARLDHIRPGHRRAQFSRGWQCILDDDTLSAGQEPLELLFEIRVGTDQEPGRRQRNHTRASGGKRDQQRDDTTVSPYPTEFG